MSTPACGVPAARSPNWPGASPVTSRARADAHGGTMSGAGFTPPMPSSLNTLVGNPERGGRAGAGRRSVSAPWRGPRYNIAGFNAPRPAGLSRNRFPTRSRANSSAEGGGPAGYRPPRLVSGHRRLSSEMLASALAGYPYRAKVWFNHMSNPVTIRSTASRAFARPWPTSSRIRARCRLDQSVHQRDQRAGRLHRAGHRDL